MPILPRFVIAWAAAASVLAGSVLAAPLTQDIHTQSETLLLAQDANGTGLESFSMPLYELFDLSARHVGGTGFSLYGNAWGRLGFGEQTLPEQDKARLTTGFVRYDDANLGHVELGRQFLSTGPLAQPLDGGNADVRLPAQLDLNLYAGAPVEDATRRIYGGRIGWTHGWLASLGLGAFTSRVGSEADRERVGLDTVVRPWRSLELAGWGYYETVLRRFVSLRGSAGLRPWSSLYVSAEYDSSDPAALLGTTSIFSVFTAERSQSGTLRAEYTIPVLQLIPRELTPYEWIDRIVLAPELRRLWYEGGQTGWRAGGEARIYWVEDPRTFLTAGMWRQSEPERGFTESRLAAFVYVWRATYSMGELILDAYDAPLRGHRQGTSAALGAGTDLTGSLRLQASGQWIADPLTEEETQAMLKVVWTGP